MKNKLVVVVLIGLSCLAVSGCLKIGSKPQPAPLLGVYRSNTRGELWESRNRLVVPAGVGSLDGVGVLRLFADPQDARALYFSTPGGGLVYTYDGGLTWQQPSAITTGTVSDVAVDPRNTCTVYVGVSNRALKTTDCNRNYQEIYLDPRPNAVSSITVDGSSSNTIYIGTSAGELLRSVNAGASWARINQFSSGIQWMLFDPNNAKRVFLLTSNHGLYRSVDGTQSWQSMASSLAPFSQGQEIRALQFINDQQNTMMILNRYGLLKSSDGGDSWQALSLMTPPLVAKVTAFAVNPKNSQEVYYATASTFYSSIDGGANWVTRRTPGRRAIQQQMLIHPRDPATLLLVLSLAPSR